MPTKTILPSVSTWIQIRPETCASMCTPWIGVAVGTSVGSAGAAVAVGGGVGGTAVASGAVAVAATGTAAGAIGDEAIVKRGKKNAAMPLTTGRTSARFPPRRNAAYS